MRKKKNAQTMQKNTRRNTHKQCKRIHEGIRTNNAKEYAKKYAQKYAQMDVKNHAQKSHKSVHIRRLSKTFRD